MNDAQAALVKAQEEREELLLRLVERFNTMKITDPPSLSPFLGSRRAAGLLAAVQELTASWMKGETDFGQAALMEGLSQALALDEEFDERTTPVVVISLAGLRRLDSLFSELEQAREQLYGRPEGSDA